MGLTYRPSFAPDNKFSCVKPFVMNGVAYGLGDLVDTKNIEVRRLRQMYDTRMIDVASADAKPAPQPPKQAQPKKAAPAKAKEKPPVDAGKGLRAEHRGFGRYFVLDADGKEVAGPITKDEADARVAAAA
jgi:hypothetical protein